MPKFLLSFLFLFMLVFQFSFFIPSSDSLQAASLVPCGLSSGDTSQTAPCTLCHLLVGIQGIITWIRNVMTAIAIAVIVAMGILYIVSAGNDQLMGYAKGGIKAALIGFAVILCAWLIVNVILNLPIFNRTAGLIQTNWYTFSCNLSSAVQGSPIIASLPPGVTDTTPKSPPPPPGSDPIIITDPSTRVTLTLATNSVYAGGTDLLTVGGNINFNRGPITFGVNVDSISIPQATGSTTLVTVYSSTPPGTYTIQAYQSGTLLASIPIIVLQAVLPPGDDVGGAPYNPPGDGGDGGGGSGGTCVAPGSLAVFHYLEAQKPALGWFWIMYFGYDGGSEAGIERAQLFNQMGAVPYNRCVNYLQGQGPYPGGCPQDPVQIGSNLTTNTMYWYEGVWPNQITHTVPVPPICGG